jgi:hypothetical protein
MLIMSEWVIVLPYGSGNVTYYDELADAFRAGQTYLLRAPPEEMLALPDPWDPAANAPFRGDSQAPGERFKGVHDLTLYHGKLYVQWGALPALALIPLRWIAGGDLPMGDVVLVIETLAALLYAVAAMRLGRIAGAPHSSFMNFVSVPLFFFCPIWVFLLRRIAVYETAVFFAQLCSSAALLCAVLAIERRLKDRIGAVWLLGLSSLLIGLALNCRPDIAPIGLMVPLILFIWWKAKAAAEPGNWRSMVSPAVALGGPAALLLVTALVYNDLRLGNPLEVGIQWQLWGGTESAWQHKLKFIEPARILPNIWYYFLCPIRFLPAGSWIVQPFWYHPRDLMSPQLVASYGDYTGYTYGLFTVMPTTIVAMFSPIFMMRRFGGVNGSGWRVTSLLMVSGFLAGILPFLAPAVTRYCAEWCMWWIIVGTIAAARIRAELQSCGWRMTRTLFDLALLCSTAWSIWASVSLLIGFRHSL